MDAIDQHIDELLRSASAFVELQSAEDWPYARSLDPRVVPCPQSQQTAEREEHR